MEKRSISVHGIFEVKDILYVEGLKANLINIIQTYDNKYLFKFTHKKCTMYDSLEILWSRVPGQKTIIFITLIKLCA